MLNHDVNDIIPTLRGKGVGVINAAPLAMGLLTRGGPPSWHPASTALKSLCRALSGLCEAEGVDISRLALWHALNADGVASTVVSCSTVDELDANIRLWKQGLTQTELAMLQRILDEVSKSGENGQWEGVEVSRYFESVGKLLLQSHLYHKELKN